jgi:predicted ABC-type ATPase
LPPSVDRPIFWIVAGPNGSGKTSAYADAEIEAFARSVWIINPDLLTARIRKVEGRPLRDANLEAVRRIEAWLEASIRAHQTVGVETVLSTDKYRRLVVAAKELGFEVRPQRSIERVRLRVAKGGHSVPERKIVERYARSLDQLPWFLDQADQASVFDNSGAQPKLIAQKKYGVITSDPDALPQIVAAVKRIATE